MFPLEEQNYALQLLFLFATLSLAWILIGYKLNFLLFLSFTVNK